jgi:hypothetical protein
MTHKARNGEHVQEEVSSLDIYWGASDRIYDYWLIVEVVGTLVH